MTSEFHLKIGLFGIGLDACWPKLPGPGERLEGYYDEVSRMPGELQGNKLVKIC